jgi:hypothetical protein
MVLVGIVVALGIAAVLVVPQLLVPAQTTTVWQAITAGISNGKVPKQTALEAFAYLYQVDIPGVTVPKGIEGGDEPTDGTGPITWVQANWDSLTADQQAVINRFLVPGPNDETVTPAEADTGQPEIQLSVARNPGPAHGQQAPDAPADLVAAMNRELSADIAHIGPKLGMAVLTPGVPLFRNIELTFSDSSGGTVLMQTAAETKELSGHYEPCHITVFKNGWQGQTVTSTGGVSPLIHVLMTHEVVHCYQKVVWGSPAINNAMPAWITEGSALYLAADDTKIAEPIIPGMWTHGYFLPETPLINRTYDAFGYYALLAHEGRDLWSLMLPAWQAAAKAGIAATSDAYIAVLGGDQPDIRDNWAESYLRKTSWGDPWIAYGFGLPDTAQVDQHPAQAQPAPGWTDSLQNRSNTVLNVDSTAGEVVIISTDGLASVHDDAGHKAIAFQSQRFCTVSSCICPAGTKLAGENMAPDVITIPFVAAFNAPESGSRYSIVSETLAELCGLPSPPPTTQPTGGGGSGDPCTAACAETNGDPHLYTVDGTPYDFQAAGEFTLLRSADGSLDIQARQEPDGSDGTVAITTAIASKVGSHRVEVYMTDLGLGARVDGNPVELSGGPIDLGGGARISVLADGSIEVDFPDGTRMWDLSTGGYGIIADIAPSPGLRAGGVGLLGPVAAGGLGVPALPDGTQLPATTDTHQAYVMLYSQFADAWRVTDAATLFVYDAGKSTASYTIRPYPIEAKAATLANLTPAQLAAGDAACTAITDSRLHDNCVYDVGITGDPGFAGSYALVQVFRNTPIASSSFPPVSSAPETPPPGVVAGAVTVTAGTAIGGYAVGPDDTAYLSVQTGANAFSLLAVDPRTGTVRQQVAVPAATEVHYAAGSLWLPGLKTDAKGNNCSVTRVDAATLVEQVTIPIPCASVIGPVVGSDGSAVWYEDTTHADPSTGKGAVAVRIDPTTNTPGTSVLLPSIGGYFLDSHGAVFYADENDGYWRLAAGSTAFEMIGTFASTPIATGSGLWVEGDDGASAQYFTRAGSPDHTVQIEGDPGSGGSLVGGNASAAYSEVEVTSASGTDSELWRFPLDGSAPTRLAVPPTVDGIPLTYLDVPPPTTTADGFLKLWLTAGDSTQGSRILLQWTIAR